MGNIYTGIKFHTEFRNKTILQSRLVDVIRHWSGVFARNNCAPAVPGGFGGNLSCREGEGFLITASGANLADLTAEQIVRICHIDQDNLNVVAEGCLEPSSETLLHGAIYQARTEINAVFHGHYPIFEANFSTLGYRITENEAEYGSLQLVQEALAILGNEKFILLRNHGFISMGTSPEEAGNTIMDILRSLGLKIQ